MGVEALLAAPLEAADPALIPPAARRRLLDRVRGLPEELGWGSVLFECRLGPEGGPVDVAFCLSELNANRDLLARLRLPDERWERARKVFENLQDWSSFHRAWLEFDVDTEGAPGIFVNPSSAAAQATLLNKLGGPTPEGHPFWLGWMLGRPGHGLRVCYRHTEIEPVQAAAGRDLQAWKGAASYHVSFDLPGDRVGVDIFGLPEAATKARGLDLCTPAQARAIQAWPGHDAIARDPERWAPSLQEASAASLGERTLYCIRRVSHVKLVFPSQTTKVYLEAFYAWGHSEGRRLRAFRG